MGQREQLVPRLPADRQHHFYGRSAPTDEVRYMGIDATRPHRREAERMESPLITLSHHMSRSGQKTPTSRGNKTLQFKIIYEPL